MNKRRIGVTLILLGLIGAGLLMLLGNVGESRAVVSFGRANVGCTTRFQFDQPGTYYIYVETGRRKVTDKNCPPSAGGDKLDVTLSRDENQAVLVPDSSLSYQYDNAQGVSLARFDVTESGRYKLTATGPDVDQIVAIGQNPVSAKRPFWAAAGFVGALGIVGGLVLLLSRRRPRSAAEFESAAPIRSAGTPPTETIAPATSTAPPVASIAPYLPPGAAKAAADRARSTSELPKVDASRPVPGRQTAPRPAQQPQGAPRPGAPGQRQAPTRRPSRSGAAAAIGAAAGVDAAARLRTAPVTSSGSTSLANPPERPRNAQPPVAAQEVSGRSRPSSQPPQRSSGPGASSRRSEVAPNRTVEPVDSAGHDRPQPTAETDPPHGETMASILDDMSPVQLERPRSEPDRPAARGERRRESAEVIGDYLDDDDWRAQVAFPRTRRTDQPSTGRPGRYRTRSGRPDRRRDDYRDPYGDDIDEFGDEYRRRGRPDRFGGRDDGYGRDYYDDPYDADRYRDRDGDDYWRDRSPSRDGRDQRRPVRRERFERQPLFDDDRYDERGRSNRGFGRGDYDDRDVDRSENRRRRSDEAVPFGFSDEYGWAPERTERRATPRYRQTDNPSVPPPPPRNENFPPPAPDLEDQHPSDVGVSDEDDTGEWRWWSPPDPDERN